MRPFNVYKPNKWQKCGSGKILATGNTQNILIEISLHCIYAFHHIFRGSTTETSAYILMPIMCSHKIKILSKYSPKKEINPLNYWPQNWWFIRKQYTSNKVELLTGIYQNMVYKIQLASQNKDVHGVLKNKVLHAVNVTATTGSIDNLVPFSLNSDIVRLWDHHTSSHGSLRISKIYNNMRRFYSTNKVLQTWLQRMRLSFEPEVRKNLFLQGIHFTQSDV